MDNPEYVQIDDIRYKIKTDYRNAIKFEEIIRDKSISDYEKILGCIYTLYGDEGINHPEHHERLLKSALKYLQGRPSAIRNDVVDNKKVKRDMDYKKDWGLIVASMRSEYGIDVINEKIHWWTFYDLLNGLSSECIFNRVRDIRTRDLSKEKDKEIRDNILKLRKIYSLDEDEELSSKQRESVDTFYKLTGIERKVKNGE